MQTLYEINIEDPELALNTTSKLINDDYVGGKVLNSVCLVAQRCASF